MKGKVLVTGASGFIGYHLVEALVKVGYEVTAAIRPSSATDHLEDFNLKYVYLDFTSAEEIRQHLDEKQYEYIIHTAGITKASGETVYNEVNAIYTQNLAIAASVAQIPLKKFVFISSLAALGPRYYEDPTPIREVSLPNPVTAYGKSKLLAEQYLKNIELPIIILRPTGVYGPRERDFLVMFKTLAKGFEPYIGRKKQLLSFVYAKDLVQSILLAMHSDVTGRTYNVSDGQVYDRYELANLTKKILGRRTFKIHIPLPVVKLIASMNEAMASGGNTPVLNKEKLQELTAENWNCSIDSIVSELGYLPQYNLERGLTETLQWYQKNKWL
ncbi:NAD-dependent epimerase/dehydratase family protein [Chitinophagaceae bacterium MMS25-I14]